MLDLLRKQKSLSPYPTNFPTESVQFFVLHHQHKIRLIMSPHANRDAPKFIALGKGGEKNAVLAQLCHPFRR
jgi:hypothetical protein